MTYNSQSPHLDDLSEFSKHFRRLVLTAEIEHRILHKLLEIYSRREGVPRLISIEAETEDNIKIVVDYSESRATFYDVDAFLESERRRPALVDGEECGRDRNDLLNKIEELEESRAALLALPERHYPEGHPDQEPCRSCSVLRKARADARTAEHKATEKLWEYRVFTLAAMLKNTPPVADRDHKARAILTAILNEEVRSEPRESEAILWALKHLSLCASGRSALGYIADHLGLASITPRTHNVGNCPSRLAEEILRIAQSPDRFFPQYDTGDAIRRTAKRLLLSTEST